MFKEETFPFKDPKSYPDSLFPIVTLPADLDPELSNPSSPFSSHFPTSVRTIISS